MWECCVKQREQEPTNITYFIMKSLISSPAGMRWSFPDKLFSVNVNYEMEAVIQIHQAYVTLWLPGVRIHLHCSYLTTHSI